MQKRLLGTSFLLLPVTALSAGTTMPDMGQDLLLVLLMGFCAVFFVWIAHRLFPSWRNRLRANPKLGKLGSFNTAAAVIVIVAILICLAAQSFFILIVGFVGAPILGVALLVEIIWGWSTSKSPT